MAKYKVTIQPDNLWKDEKVKEVIALDVHNAKEIVLMRNKTCHVVGCVRLGSGASTLNTLDGIRDDMETALKSNNDELANRHKDSFMETVASLKSKMDVVSWGKAEKRLPKLPKIY